MSITHRIFLPSTWEQRGIFTFSRPWASLLQHNRWRKDRSVTLEFWISLHFYGWMSWLSHLFNVFFFFFFSFPLSFSFFVFFLFWGSKPYFLLLTNNLCAHQLQQYWHSVFTPFFYSIEQSWLSKVLKYVPGFKYMNSEGKVNGSHHSLNFDMCLSTLLYWVFLCIKNLLVCQHFSLKSLIDLLNQSSSQIEE